MFEGEVIKTVLPVQGLSFTTIPTEDFMEISNSVDDDIVRLPILTSCHVQFTALHLAFRFISYKKNQAGRGTNQEMLSRGVPSERLSLPNA